jgi:ribonuclease VapC
MIVIDSSAVVASLLEEVEAEDFIALIRASEGRLLSAASYLECAIVLTREAGRTLRLEQWIEYFEIEVVAVDFAQARIAADAFQRFGRGRHPARLNYGDCFAYALAASRGAPLLYKGTDFGKTDIVSALSSPL